MIRYVSEFRAMCDPRIGIDFAILDLLDDLGKLSGKCVTTGEHGELTLVEMRIVEAHNGLN